MIADMFAAAVQSLFKRMLNNEQHVLQPLLPDRTNVSYNLRPSHHNRQKRKTLHINDSLFIIKILCKDSYWTLSHITFYLSFISCRLLIVAISHLIFYTTIWIDMDVYTQSNFIPPENSMNIITVEIIAVIGNNKAEVALTAVLDRPTNIPTADYKRKNIT